MQELVDLSLIGKQLHWAVVGHAFRPVHEQLDELVASWRGLADVVAERAVALGYVPDGQPRAVAAGSPLSPVAAEATEFHALMHGALGPIALGVKLPYRIRAAALSVAASAQWIANWAITTSFPLLKGAGLGLAYGIYAAFAVLFFVFVRRVIAQTNGREREAMPEQVRLPPPPKVLRDRPQFEV